MYEQSLHPPKDRVWTAISRERIVGPILFESISTERYSYKIVYPVKILAVDKLLNKL